MFEESCKFCGDRGVRRGVGVAGEDESEVENKLVPWIGRGLETYGVGQDAIPSVDKAYR